MNRGAGKVSGETGSRRRPIAPYSSGPGVDSAGHPVPDPTKNVFDLVDAAVRRLDDLREQQAAATRENKQTEHEHIRELMAIRAEYEEKLRLAETARIDAIRNVDVNAVNRAAEVSAAQASTLAAQVVTSAEALRAQVQAAAAQAATALAAALVPIQTDIADLKKTQYEQAGSKAQVSETREVRGETRLNIGAVLGALSVLLVLVFGIVGLLLTQP